MVLLLYNARLYYGGWQLFIDLTGLVTAITVLTLTLTLTFSRC
ncbi:MAG: hypothetical protein ACI92O_001916 [Colwellia sp.]|jgi:hypothetical protein